MKHTKEILEKLAKESFSVMQVCTKLGLKKSGSANGHIKRRMIKFGIDMSHFKGQGWSKGKDSKRKKNHEEYLIIREDKSRLRASLLRRSLKEAGMKYECAKCGNDGKWLDKNLTLEVDHINEQGWDNRFENLQFLCPNCHSIKTFECDKRKK